MRLASRDTFRLAWLECTTPFCPACMITGCAARNAVAAEAWSPDAIASSTFLISDRMRVRRALLTSVRRSVWRAAFFADDVLAMCKTFLKPPQYGEIDGMQNFEVSFGPAARLHDPAWV